MKKRKKAAVLALSATVFAAAWLLAEEAVRQPAEEALAPTEETPESIDLSIGRAREITAMSWAWEGQTVNLRWDDAAARWTNAEDADCPVDNAAALALARAAADVHASMAIEGATDLAQYGLDKPSLTVEAATEETVAVYEVGHMSITGEYYVRLAGENTVYMEGGDLAAFRVTLEDILEKETLPEATAEATGISVTSGAGDYEIRRRTGGAEPGWYRVDGGEEVLLAQEGAQSLADVLMDMELSECVSWGGDAADYGLDEAMLRAELTYVDEEGVEASLAVEFGDYTGSEVYVRIADSARIYRTAAAVPDALLYPDWTAIEPAAVMTLDTAAIDSVRIGMDDESWDILRLEEVTERTVGEGDETVEVTEVIYSANGWVLDTKTMESWLASLAGLTVTDTAPSGEGRQTLLSVTLTWKDTESIPAELELRSYDSGRALVVVGGDRLLLVDREEAADVVADARTLLAGMTGEE